MMAINVKKIAIARHTHKLFYAKTEEGNKCFCPFCNSNWIASNKEVASYKRLHICPVCKSEVWTVTNTTKEDYRFTNTVMDYRPKYEYFNGYLIMGRISKGELVIDDEIHVLKTEKGKRGKMHYYIKNCYISAQYGNYKVHYDACANWYERKATVSPYYGTCFLDAFKEGFDLSLKKPKSAKDLTADVMRWCNIRYDALKSNQRYMVQHNLMTPKMIECMFRCDVNNYSCLYDCANWISAQNNFNLALRHKIREYDICYMTLARASLIDYCDYLDQCKELGIKNKHPKEFVQEHQKLSTIISLRRNKLEIDEANAKIKYFNYPATKIKNIVIEPYMDAEQMKIDADEFKICIFASYLGKYADRKTLLYRATIDGKLIACIELNKDSKEVKQIRGKHNSAVPEHNDIAKACLQMLNEEFEVEEETPTIVGKW